MKKGDDTNIILPHHEDNPSHNKMFMKDSAIIIERLMAINPFMEELFIKVGTDFKFRQEGINFVNLIPDIGQQQYETFVELQLVKCQVDVSSTIKRNNFVTTGTKVGNRAGKDKMNLKDSEYKGQQ